MKYSGLAVLSVSLIMLSLGSIPQSYAGSGSVGSTMTLQLTCGLTVAGDVTWGSGILLDTIIESGVAPHLTASTATVQNTGVGQATVDANTGNDIGPATFGGYSEAGGTNHINNPQIEINIGNGFVTMAAGDAVDITIGTVAEGATDDLDMRVDLNFVVGLPTVDNSWLATVTVTGSDCELV